MQTWVCFFVFLFQPCHATLSNITTRCEGLTEFPFARCYNPEADLSSSDPPRSETHCKCGSLQHPTSLTLHVWQMGRITYAVIYAAPTTRTSHIYRGDTVICQKDTGYSEYTTLFPGRRCTRSARRKRIMPRSAFLSSPSQQCYGSILRLNSPKICHTISSNPPYAECRDPPHQCPTIGRHQCSAHNRHLIQICRLMALSASSYRELVPFKLCSTDSPCVSLFTVSSHVI